MAGPSGTSKKGKDPGKGVSGRSGSGKGRSRSSSSSSQSEKAAEKVRHATQLLRGFFFFFIHTRAVLFPSCRSLCH